MYGYSYIGIVTETSNRRIRANCTDLGPAAGWIDPLLDGNVKLPVPAVGDTVVVIDLDTSAVNRRYVHIGSSFDNITSNSSNLQLESKATVDIDGSTINIGTSGLEPAVLGDTLVTKLESILDAIQLITVTGNMGYPTSVPLNSATFASIKALIAEIKSAKVNVE